MDGATITITMGGVDMSTYYSNGKIAIPNVTGNITITATAVSSAPTYTNLANPSDAHWTNNARLNSSGQAVAQNGATVTNYISCVFDDVVRIKGFGSLTDYNTAFYIGDKTVYSSSKLSPNGSSGLYSYTYDASTGIVIIKILKSNITSVRFSGIMTGTANDVVITVNEDLPA